MTAVGDRSLIPANARGCTEVSVRDVLQDVTEYLRSTRLQRAETSF